MDKRERGRLWRGSPADQEVGISMRYVGIDVGSDSHVVAAVTADGTVAFKPTGIAEDAAGYAKLFALLGQGPVALVTIEATGHYWRNLFAALVVCGYAVALLNPLRTRRFAGEDLARTKTDSIDALGIARFGAQKCPAVTRLPDAGLSPVPLLSITYMRPDDIDFADGQRFLISPSCWLRASCADCALFFCTPAVRESNAA